MFLGAAGLAVATLHEGLGTGERVSPAMAHRLRRSRDATGPVDLGM